MHPDAVADAVRQAIAAHDLLPDGARVLVGVSGGVDSMVLAHVLDRLGYDVHVGHVNYGLRGDASDADASLVSRYCKSKSWTYRERIVEESIGEERSVQEAARDLRYRFLASMAEDLGCAAVAVAHHADDQAETVLLQLLRGTALHGLAGMPWGRRLDTEVRLIRPLLGVRREALTQYAQANDVPWREDASNQDPVYTRNRLRTNVLPILEAEFGPSVVPHLARTADYVRAYLASSWEPLRQALWTGCASDEGPVPALRLSVLRRLPAVWQTRIVLDALAAWLPAVPQTEAVAESVRDLLFSQPGRRVDWNAQGAVWRGRERLWFVREVVAMTETLDLAGDGAVAFWGGHVLVEQVPALPQHLPGCGTGYIYLPQHLVASGLTVRAWQPGDRFRAFDGSGHQKVSDVLTDAQVPVYARLAMPVVVRGGDVLWVIGVKAAEAVRVRNRGVPVGRLSLVPGPAWPLR